MYCCTAPWQTCEQVSYLDIYETLICYNISVSQTATAGKERQTVYEYKKILSRPHPGQPPQFLGRSPRRNERPYNENMPVVTNAPLQYKHVSGSYIYN